VFADLVEEASGWLPAAGVARGQTVAVLRTPNVDVIAWVQGAARVGAVPALLSAGCDMQTLRVLLGRLKPALTVTDEPPPPRIPRCSPALPGPWAGSSA